MKVVIFDRSNPRSLASPAYLQAYRAWHAVWTEAYAPKGVSRLFSDGFTRQDQIVAFYLEDKCCALVCHHEVDLRNPVDRDDSRLDGWPVDLLDDLSHSYSKVLVASNLTVPHEFRRRKFFGVTMKELAMAGIFQHLEFGTQQAATLGSLRLTKGSEKPAYRSGAKFLRRVDHLGEPTDLAVWERGHYTPTPEVAAVFSKYWMPQHSAA